MPDWPKLTFEAAGVALIDCMHATPQAQTAGYPYVAIPDLRNGHIDFSKSRRISSDDYSAWTKKAAPRLYDVILSRRTNPGVTAVDRTGQSFALGQNLVLLRSNGSAVHPPFLRWLTKGPEWWSEVARFNNVGAVFDSLKCADVPKFCLTIPPLPVQEEISEFLDALDDKIELNRHMNETLEAMAQAIFRDWFIDFGPTRRKLAGITDPVEIMGGLAPDAARATVLSELFPATISDNGLPEGWTERPLRDAAQQHTAAISPSSAPDELFEHYSLPAFDEGKAPALELGSSILSNKTHVPHGCVLLSKLNPEIKRVWLVPASGVSRQVCSTEFLAFTPSSPFGRSWLYCLFSSHEFRSMLTSMVTGTSKSHQRVAPKALAERLVFFADNAVHEAFESLVTPVLSRALHNQGESQTLAATRDLLLPKLMSGEIRLGHVEVIAENAT